MAEMAIARAATAQVLIEDFMFREFLTEIGEI